MGTHSTPPRRSRPPSAQAPQTCEIVWWRGYVTGRFQAWTKPKSGPPQLVGESPSIRWRRSSPPGQGGAAVAALESLIERLTDQGWAVAARPAEAWYGHVLGAPPDDAGQLHAAEALFRELARAPVLKRFGPELAESRSEPESEREPHVATEDQPRRVESEPLDPGAVAPSPRVSPAAGKPASAPRRQAALFAIYALAVLGAAAVFLVGFHSGYAAAVAALTASALSLGVDSWLLARRPLIPHPSGSGKNAA
jgi:hypothetical protein